MSLIRRVSGSLAPGAAIPPNRAAARYTPAMLVLSLWLACGPVPYPEVGKGPGEPSDTSKTDTDPAAAADTPGADTPADTPTETPEQATDSPVDTPDESPADTPAPPAVPLHIGIISDLNSSYGSTTYATEVHRAVDALIAAPPDVVLIPGDMVAGQQSGLDYAAMWAGFHAAVTDRLTAAGIPVLPSPGNHDASAYSGYSAERAAYTTAWAGRLPNLPAVDVTNWPFRHAWRVDDVLLVALDDTKVGPIDAAQRTWLEGLLAPAARGKVVFGHVPLHPFTVGRETEVLADAALETVMRDGGTDVFVSGHHHGWYPGWHDGLRVASMPCLGSGARALIGTSTTAPKALVRLTVGSQGGIDHLEAYEGTTMSAQIPRASLPTQLSYGGVTVVREDLGP